MQKNKKKVAIYIGRFAPLHNGHIETIPDSATIKTSRSLSYFASIS